MDGSRWMVRSELIVGLLACLLAWMAFCYESNAFVQNLLMMMSEGGGRVCVDVGAAVDGHME